MTLDDLDNSEQLSQGRIDARPSHALGQMKERPIVTTKSFQANAIDCADEQSARLSPHGLPESLMEPDQIVQDWHWDLMQTPSAHPTQDAI
jgi:hypothetical protein